MIYETDFQKQIENAFLTYGASVAQERAIPDVRDMLKIGLRQGLYAQFTNKLTHKDKIQKAQKSVAAAMAQSYVHGDVAMYDTFIRAARPWSYRYPLEDVQGSYGNPSSPDSHAAARYVEMRAGETAEYFFAGLKKNAIGGQWYSNYDDTEQIPSVFPSIGFWNIVNGCSGIAVAMATSVPQFNLKEVNEALIKIIQNPDIDFDSIYCAPDFACGSTIINAMAAKESIKNGTGESIRIRAKLDYIPDKNAIRATELPYGVFTNTIINELGELCETNDNYGIEKVTDHTKKEADIFIYLSKNANPKKMIDKLYKDTSLENWYPVNMILLDQGRFPKVFGWRQACDAYIAHIRQCKRNEIQFDLDKYLARLNVIEGLIIAAANIDDVVAIIRSSQTPAEASDKLIVRYSFNEEQTKAILAMKLSSLTKIDGIKLDNEREEVKQNISNCHYLLNDSTALDNELIKILREVADKFGDARRTKIMNLAEEETSTELVEEKQVGVLVFNNNSIRVVPQEDLPEAKRGRKGAKLKLPKGIELVNTFYTTNLSSIAAFSDKGKMYSLSLAELDLNEDYSLYDIIAVEPQENIILIDDATAFYAYKNLITVSKQGLIKKTATKEYNIRNKKGTIAVKLADDDQLIGVHLSMSDDDKIAIAASNNLCVYYSLIEVNATGRATKGVKAMKLAEGEYIISSTLIRANTEYCGILSITTSGRGKILPIDELLETSRTSKGHTIMDTKEDNLALISAISTDKEKIFISTSKNKCVLININEIPIGGRTTCGNLLIDCRDDTSTIRVM